MNLFDRLTKLGVTDSKGNTKYYDGNLDAIEADAAANAGNVPTYNENLNATIAPQAAPVAPAVTTQDTSAIPPTIAAPDAAATPAAATPPQVVLPSDPAPTFTQVGEDKDNAHLTKPNFLQADTSVISPALTTKGKVLAGILSGAMGGLMGAGQRTIGGGFQQAVTLPVDIRARSAQADQEQQKAALEAAQVANIPTVNAQAAATHAADIGLKNAEAAFYTQGKNYGTPEARSAFVKENPQYFKTPDEQSNYVIFGSKEKPTAADTFEARGQQLQQLRQLYQGSEGLSQAQEQEYQLTGKITKEATEHNTSPAELAIRAAQGDKSAARALTLYGSATRPNFTPGNQENAHSIATQDEADVTTALGAAMAGHGDPTKGLARLDAMAADPRATPEQLKAIGKARLQLVNQGKGAKNSPAALLQGLGITAPQPAQVP